MITHSQRTSSPSSPQRTPGTPRWWTEQHTSSWEKVKQAFRRDWEQTKADLSSNGGRSLNQNAIDTIEQAFASAPPLPLDVKTRPTDPKDAANVAAKAARHAAEESGKARETIDKAHADMSATSVKLNDRIEDIRSGVTATAKKSEEKISAAQHSAIAEADKQHAKMEEIAIKVATKPARQAVEAKVASRIDGDVAIADARAKLHDTVVEARTDLAKQEAKATAKIVSARHEADRAIAEDENTIAKAIEDRTAATAEWRDAEQEARYGFSARTQYPRGHAWNGELEAKLQREWEGMGMNRSWHEAKLGVRRGWEYDDVKL